MLLLSRKKDDAFKKALLKCIDPNGYDPNLLFSLLSEPHGYSPLGECLWMLPKLPYEKAGLGLRCAFQIAEGSDYNALFLVSYLIMIAMPRETKERIEFSRLGPERKSCFSTALDFAAELGGNISDRDLLSVEVIANCEQSHSTSSFRLGQVSTNRLGDMILKGKDDDRRFALGLLKQTHKAKVHVYDECFPELIQSMRLTSDPKLARQIDLTIRFIKRTNPEATLSWLIRGLWEKLQVSKSVANTFDRDIKSYRLSPKLRCLLALAIAERLEKRGMKEAALEILSRAAASGGDDLKLRAWVGLALGDDKSAVRSMFEYARSKTVVERHWGWIEQSHAIEVACQRLFVSHSVFAAEEFDRQIVAFKKSNQLRALSRILEWRASLSSFDEYLSLQIEPLERLTEDPNELRISQRKISTYYFLQFALEPLVKHLNSGIEWFEKSATGNDAPWIKGDRSLLGAVKESLASRSDIKSVESKFRNAANLLQSMYPIALHLVNRSLLIARTKLDAMCIQQLSLAIEVLNPRTPELREIRHRCMEARWELVDSFAHRKLLSKNSSRKLWIQIASIAPLLSGVIDEEMRIRQHFSPTCDFTDGFESSSLQDLKAIKDRNERGRALESAMVKAIDTVAGMEVLETRQRNSYEEIDIVVSVGGSSPLISHWGPLLIIECKNWNQKVGTEPTRAFYTKMLTKKGAIRLGVIIATSGFTAGVKELSRLFQDALIVLIDQDKLDKVLSGSENFGRLLENAIADALFS